jgi:two-component system sensor histidine kinase MprB
MTANVEWLMRAPDVDPETQRKTLAGVRRELGELNEVMSEIIELAIDSREQPEPVLTDLLAVADDVVQRFARRSDREVVVESSPVTVMGDADSLARAMTNL